MCHSILYRIFPFSLLLPCIIYLLFSFRLLDYFRKFRKSSLHVKESTSTYISYYTYTNMTVWVLLTPLEQFKLISIQIRKFGKHTYIGKYSSRLATWMNGISSRVDSFFVLIHKKILYVEIPKKKCVYVL